MKTKPEYTSPPPSPSPRRGEGWEGGRLGRTDDIFEQDLAGQPVADVLVADEAGGIDRDDRDGNFFPGRLAYRLDIVAGHGGDAGGIDKDCLRLWIAHDQIQYGLV